MLLFYNFPLEKKMLSEKKQNIIDEKLFLRIAQKDMDALEELYYLTDKTVYAYALSILQNMQDAQDVMQDTYLKIRAGAHLYQPMGKPLAWILTIVKNLCLVRIRNKKRFADNAIEEYENAVPVVHCTHIEDKIILNHMINHLSQEERQIVVLHSISGMKHIEIAKFLKIGLSTELSKYSRALKKLKKFLIEGGYHES